MIAPDSLPQVQSYQYDEWPELRDGQREMEFRLSYQGRLPAASSGDTRSKDKHRIRKHIHRQLKELWKTDRFLRKYYLEMRRGGVADSDGAFRYQLLADNFAFCGHRFLPLVGTDAGDDACSLDILFLRRDHPGDLVRSGGDIDNRMKVLLDALKVPDNCSGLPSQPDDDEDPFFCLLRDDSLITQLKITTDRLLTPIIDGENINDVHLVIHVNTISYAVNLTADL